jgi:hypothetical protein
LPYSNPTARRGDGQPLSKPSRKGVGARPAPAPITPQGAVNRQAPEGARIVRTPPAPDCTYPGSRSIAYAEPISHRVPTPVGLRERPIYRVQPRRVPAGMAGAGAHPSAREAHQDGGRRMGISRLFSWIRLRRRPVVARPAADAPVGAEPGSDSAPGGAPADAEPPDGGYVLGATAGNESAAPSIMGGRSRVLGDGVSQMAWPDYPDINEAIRDEWRAWRRYR